MTDANRELHYIILQPRQDITLNLFEAELYEPAIIVQQLIGTLIYYSNKGRYEPRLAESWNYDETLNTWTFKLKKGLRAENGEPITPVNFKKSLERSIFIYARFGGLPHMSLLRGYDEFIQSNEFTKNIKDLKPLLGIQADEENLKFVFEKRQKSGILQILSFSPLGYLSIENFTDEGQWKDNKKLISSGPYLVETIEIGRRYVLRKNENWPTFAPKAPDRVVFTHNAQESSPGKSMIVDAYMHDWNSDKFELYKLVPEYLNSVLLGNFESGFFAESSNRKLFKQEFDSVRERTLPNEFLNHLRSNSFYPNQTPISAPPNLSGNTTERFTWNGVLRIEGKVPEINTPRWYAWTVLKTTLENLGLAYRFAENESSTEEITNNLYDLRIRGASIGGGVEAWGLSVIFCSPLGIRFPDPSGRVCQLLENYELGRVGEDELRTEFFRIVEEDAAILPVTHYGIQLFLSEGIAKESFSKLMSIIRLDQLEIQ